MATANMVELGSTGLRRNSGQIAEEFLRELQGPRWFKVVRQMQQDAIVGAILLAIELSLRQVAVTIKPADDTPAAQEVANFVKSCLTDMSSSWADTLAEILTMLPYGWAYLECVYKRRLGDNADPSKHSKYIDGKIGWRKWAIRAQDSLDSWDFDDRGGVQGMWQTQEAGAPILIPIEKALLFRTTAHKGNPEGKSILRSGYRSWYMLTNIENIEGIGVERDLAGLPVAKLPAQYMSSTATASQQALYAEIKKIVINIRRDEQEGIVFPSDRDEHGNELFSLELLSSGGSRQFDTGAIIGRYKNDIAMSALADFILLGHEKVGSYALSATKSSLFRTALQAWLISIADVINTHGIPRLVRLNGFPLELMPTLGFGAVGEIDLADVINWVKEVAGAGGQVFPHLATENALRMKVGMPELDEDEFNEREEANQQDKEAERAAKARQPFGNEPQEDEDAQDEKMSAAEMRAHLQAADRVLARGTL